MHVPILPRLFVSAALCCCLGPLASSAIAAVSASTIGASTPLLSGAFDEVALTVDERRPYGHTFAYTLPRDADVSLAVYEVTGRRHAVLDEGRRPAGTHEVVWNAAGVSPGVYFVRLRTGGATSSRTVFVAR